MAKVNLVDKKAQMSLPEIVRFQIITHCYIHGLNISETDVKCLSLLALNQEANLADFCNSCCEPARRTKETDLPYVSYIFKTPQTVRNCITKMEKIGMVVRVKRRNIALNPEIKIQTSGNIVLNYKIFHIDPQESQAVNKLDSATVEC